MAKKHPKALYILFMTEIWERFGFYSMLAAFFLYLDEHLYKVNGLDLQAASARASLVYGIYMALVYLTPLLGGFLADRFLGYRKAVLIGAALMAAGYFTIGANTGESEPLLFVALGILALGNGFFKPNIGTMVGNLYPQGDPRRDSGYSIFYMGVNIGAFFAPIFAYIFNKNLGYHWVFFISGTGMVLGFIIFSIFFRYLKLAEQRSSVSAVLQVNLPKQYEDPRETPTVEKERIKAILIMCTVVIFFWVAFHQNGSVLTSVAKDHTDNVALDARVRQVETAVLGDVKTPLVKLKNAVQRAVNAFGIKFTVPDEALEKKTLADEEANRVQQSKSSDPKIAAKFTALLEKDKEAKAATAEEAAAQIKKFGYKTSDALAELYQCINAFFIVLLTPFFTMLMAYLNRRNKEPTTPTKLAIGMVLTAVSFLVMVVASLVGGNTGRVSPMWLVTSYFVITLGELCLSPMGLSMVTKLAPRRMTSLMLGMWYLATSIGNYLCGYLAKLWWIHKNGHSKLMPHSLFFLILVLTSLAAAGILFTQLKRLNAAMPPEGKK